jgi:hypothetical protein
MPKSTPDLIYAWAAFLTFSSALLISEVPPEMFLTICEKMEYTVGYTYVATAYYGLAQAVHNGSCKFHGSAGDVFKFARLQNHGIIGDYLVVE